jgi:nitrate/nitrite transporter NarK
MSNAAHLSAVLRDPRSRMHLVGCSVAWFILDFYIYGVSIFSPLLLSIIFKDTATLTGNCWQNIVSNLVTLPVAGLSVLALTTSADPRDLQIVGFLVTAGALVAFALTWVRFKDDPNKLFALFCMLKGSMVLFVPPTTFVLPNTLFPVRVRASCNGIAAAAGKLGAFVGAMLFPVVFEVFGMVSVCLACSLAALLGAASTAALLPRRQARQAYADGSGSGMAAAAGGTRMERQPLLPLKEVG